MAMDKLMEINKWKLMRRIENEEIKENEWMHEWQQGIMKKWVKMNNIKLSEILIIDMDIYKKA